MRILHLDSGRELRGGQWQALRLHGGLLAAGHESLLLAREGSPLLDAAREESCRAKCCAPLRVPMQSRRFDIVHAHDARSHTLGALFARGAAGGFEPGCLSRARFGGLAMEVRARGFFIAVSRFVARELRRAGWKRPGLRWCTTAFPCRRSRRAAKRFWYPDARPAEGDGPR
jgi:hypothetical protein